MASHTPKVFDPLGQIRGDLIRGGHRGDLLPDAVGSDGVRGIGQDLVNRVPQGLRPQRAGSEADAASGGVHGGGLQGLVGALRPDHQRHAFGEAAQGGSRPTVDQRRRRSFEQPGQRLERHHTDIGGAVGARQRGRHEFDVKRLQIVQQFADNVGRGEVRAQRDEHAGAAGNVRWHRLFETMLAVGLGPQRPPFGPGRSRGWTEVVGAGVEQPSTCR
jgi:hypothetical protein